MVTGPKVQAEINDQLIPVTVQKGNNLIHLARDYCTSRDAWKEIAKINNLSPPYILQTNQTLLIPYALLLTDELSAEVIHTSGSVTKYWQNGQLRPLYQGDAISTGQSVTTGKDGYVQLLFPGNKITRIEPHSELVVKLLFKLIDGTTRAELYLEKGNLVHDVQEEMKTNETFNTKTAVSITGIRGTNFRMKMVDSETNVVETLKGKVQLKNNNHQEIILTSGRGSIVKKGEPLQPPKFLPLPPLSPELDPVYKSLPIGFPQIKDPIGKHIRLRISHDKKGQRTLLSKKMLSSEKIWIPHLDDGTYFAFFTAFDSEGFESTPTDPIEFKVQTIPSTPIITRSQSDITTWKKQIAMQWLKTEHAAEYVVEIAKDTNFTQLIGKQTLTGTTFPTPDLEPGTYYFRVQSLTSGGLASNFSAPTPFKVIDAPLFGGLTSEKANAPHLLWPKIEAPCTYDLEIAKSKDFSDLQLSQKMLSDNQLTLPDKLPEGTYYVRTRATLEDGLQGNWTPPQEMVITPENSKWGIAVVGLFVMAVAL